MTDIQIQSISLARNFSLDGNPVNRLDWSANHLSKAAKALPKSNAVTTEQICATVQPIHDAVDIYRETKDLEPLKVAVASMVKTVNRTLALVSKRSIKKIQAIAEERDDIQQRLESVTGEKLFPEGIPLR